jgi:N-acylneuraminate cytidylyltransferase
LRRLQWVNGIERQNTVHLEGHVSDPSVLALIPARGGSKSIPRKNVMNIAGRPLIAWSIAHALESAQITRIIVSTDDEEIAEVSEQWGAEVPFIRPLEYAQDLSPDIDVFRHCLDFLSEHEEYYPDVVVHLRPTAPVRRVSDIDAAIDLLLDHPSADAVRSISVARETPYKMWTLQGDGTIEPILRLADIPDCQSQARQTLPLVYAQDGLIDVVRPGTVLEKASMCGDIVLPYLTEIDVFDLDYPEDIEPIERALLGLQEGRELPKPQAGRVPA